MQHLLNHGIQTRPGTHAVYRQGYYRNKYHIPENAFPIAAMSEDCTITLPLFPSITEKEQSFVVKNIKEALLMMVAV